MDPRGRVVRGGSEDTVREHLMKTDKVTRRLLGKLKAGRGPKKFAKAIEEVLAVGGNKAGYALWQYSQKYAKPEKMESIFETLDKVGGRYAIAFFLGDQGLGSGDKQTRLAAAKALGKHGDKSTLWSLVELANGEEDPEVKEALDETIKGINEG